MSKTFLLVRAVVADAGDRDAFDAWYASEHLPDALKAFKTSRGWRAWSRTDPAVHIACYEFASVEAAQRATEDAVIKPSIAEFDRRWDSRVTRSREVIEVVDEREE
jgi:hypothetical protein